MKFGKADLVLLAAGVAARLHIDKAQVSAHYAPSIYQLTPVGIEDEGAELKVTVRFGEEYRGVHLRTWALPDRAIPDLAEQFAGRLGNAIADLR